MHHVLAHRGGALLEWGVTHRPSSTVQPLVARGFFGGGDPEVEKLRRENAELKRKLNEGEQSAPKGGILDKVGEAAQGLRGLFGGSKDRSLDVARGSSLPSALGLVGSLIKPMIGLVGNMLQAAQSDVAVVQDAAEAAVLRSGRLGSRVERGPTMSQSYSSMNINGQQTTQLQLQYQVQGDRGVGTVYCDASVKPGGDVEFRDLRLDGNALDWRGGGGGGQSGVIDVER